MINKFLKDNKTLVMISAVKSLNANFKYDIKNKYDFCNIVNLLYLIFSIC